jgi:hypothetical protein
MQSHYRRQPNNISENDDIIALRAEVSELRNTIDQMSMLVNQLLSSFNQNQYQFPNNLQFSQSLPITTTQQLF